MVKIIQEHDLLTHEKDERYGHLRLVQWDKSPKGEYGYYASFKIGAEWIDDKEALIVTTKRGMEDIDFLGMFMTCFSSGLSLESFSEIYSIDTDKPAIAAPSLRGVLSLLLITHFMGVVGRIKTLKRGYAHRSENLKKVKGRINIIRNERLNTSGKRLDRVFCNYDEYTTDIPENRIIKKALLFSQRIIDSAGGAHSSNAKLKMMLAKALSLFDNVSSETDAKEVRLSKGHKLYAEYREAVRLAKMILSQFDYSINKAGQEKEGIIAPFMLDMSLLYEHYVYGLLHEAYGNGITYQYSGKTGYPDFLYATDDCRAVLDTKYIPKYDSELLNIDNIRQLSGYARDIDILKRLGYGNVTETSEIPTVPCIIIYPMEDSFQHNPFMGKKLSNLLTNAEKGLSQFYKIAVPLPTL